MQNFLDKEENIFCSIMDPPNEHCPKSPPQIYAISQLVVENFFCLLFLKLVSFKKNLGKILVQSQHIYVDCCQFELYIW